MRISAYERERAHWYTLDSILEVAGMQEEPIIDINHHSHGEKCSAFIDENYIGA